MTDLDKIFHRLAYDAAFRSAFLNAPAETAMAHGWALTKEECQLLERLRSLLTLPSEELAHRLLNEIPDGISEWWVAQPSSANVMP